MKGTGAAIKVGITALIIAAIGYSAFKFVNKGLQGASGYTVWALFGDASGLVDKSRVQIAGLNVGELKSKALYYDPVGQKTLARIELLIRPDITLWSNASIKKVSSSLLGEFYLELVPGTPNEPDLSKVPSGGAPGSTGMVPVPTRPTYPLAGCVERSGVADCNRIRSVIEATTTTDVLVQVSETLPVLRDILRDVHNLTQKQLPGLVDQAALGLETNSKAVEKLLVHVDEIAKDVRGMTNPQGPVYEDLRESLRNVRDITESIKSIAGSGQGQMTSTVDKVKHNLDQITASLDKINHALDRAGGLVDDVADGKGTVGKLLTDDTIARNVTDITEDATNFAKTLFRLQTNVDIREEYNFLANSWKTYLSLKLQPRPDKYYLIELVDDPRGSRQYNHTLQQTTVTGVDGKTSAPSTFNTDTWTRTRDFRVTFQFAKRVQWRGVGFTGRLGIKESTGGFGGDIDFWKQRFVLKIDLFDFATSAYPRLKVMAAIELFKHVWLAGGVDDVINSSTNSLPPVGITCGTGITPASWCKGGFDAFAAIQLSFTDEDLRSLLAVGGSALGSAAK